MKKLYFAIQLLFSDLMNFIQVLIVLPHALRFNNLKTKTSDSKSKLLILGNGPSLFTSLDQVETEIIDKYDILCVNGFATSDKYTSIKPKIYFIVDPAYFRKPVNVRMVLLIDELFTAIFQKTSWKLNLFLPHNANKSKISELLKQNVNINIIYFFNNSIFGGHDFFNKIYFNLGIANPFSQNVLITGIYWGIRNNFKDIRIVGADHSWLDNYKMGNDNKLYLIDKHFDNSDVEPILLTNAEGENVKLHDELLSLYRCFAVYHQLDTYAKTKGINIVNCTKNSWIDAFARGTL